MAIEHKNYIIHPHKFVLWLFIVTIILFFGALTSAYIVSKGIEQDSQMWFQFNLPDILWYNSGVIIVSSIMLQIGIWGAKRDDFSRAKFSFVLASILGFIFLIGQFFAWSKLQSQGIIFQNTKSGSFLYILTGLHAIHLIAGLIFNLVVLIKLFNNKYSKDNMVGLSNAATFWHFLGLLWIYLFIFLLINHA